MRRDAIVLVLLLLFSPAWAGETVRIEASLDATLIEDEAGALANGAGPALFAGRTNQATGALRRALLWFDVAAALPAGAIVESATLTLHLLPSNPGEAEARLHRVLADWGEGPSVGAGGRGDPSLPGDVTWIHTFYDDAFWVRAGGQFVARESGNRQVDVEGFYTWDSTERLLADVRLWKEAPGRNFGWILLADETTPQSSKSFASRENPDPSLRPMLELTYRLPGEEP